MNNNYTKSDLLVLYLDNELSAYERLQLENELKQNTALQVELENLQLAKDAIKTYGLKQKVRSIHTEIMQTQVSESKSSNAKAPAKVVSIFRVSMRVAASLVFILLGYGIYLYTTITPSKLFSETYQRYELSTSRGASQVDELEKDYRNKNFASVIAKFTALPNTAQKENFIAGQAYLATEDYTKAIVCFNNVVNLNKQEQRTIFNDDAEYYVALSYLKSKQVALAYPIFKNIHDNSTHLYQDKVSNSFMRQLKILNWKQ